MNILTIIGAILMFGGVGGAELGTPFFLVMIQEIIGVVMVVRNLDFSTD